MPVMNSTEIQSSLALLHDLIKKITESEDYTLRCPEETPLFGDDPLQEDSLSPSIRALGKDLNALLNKVQGLQRESKLRRLADT